MAKLIYKANGCEYWAQYDKEADIWELFAEPECECYLGCADTLEDLESIAEHRAFDE